ncbi:glutamine amidotransferase class-I [Methanobacterium lacus]|uniref:Glutamine amidotransferase class-I n=1 Tax=Methanobacterium lacus (strain AL-21) TaxID=877455 RepID=F0TA87_METLA|nr:type 1 glutamine amidotransferase [Methanobacterium lacus]ADZ10037.1 glutamine amidotransferase class-I [Methanobacterium lacus]
MRLHYLQHVPFENPGSILRWANLNSVEVTKTLMFQDEDLPEHDDYDWLVVMGGPMNIYDHENYPWLVKEKSFIKTAIDSSKLVIGLCLGGQLITDVIGGEVTKNSHLEIGWFPLHLKTNAKSSPFFSFLPDQPTVFHWHGDTFNKLPENAELIAKSDACENQAFVYNDRVFGFQFHLETTEQIIDDLVVNCADEMVPGPYVQSKNELLNNENIKQTNEWMDTFLNKLFDRENRCDDI